MSANETLMAPMRGVETKTFGGVRVDVGPVGSGRVKRVIYPAGFKWSIDMKPVSGTDLCMHAHVGFLAAGSIRIEYADGCTSTFTAPEVVSIHPGHDGAVLGAAPAVLIEFDFLGETAARFGLPDAHRHG